MVGTIALVAFLGGSGFLDSLIEDPFATPPEPASRGHDMSATFAKLKTCSACIGAGYGWCPLRRRCGGFANKECGVGEAYVAEGYNGPDSKPRRAANKRPNPPPSAKSNDMSSVFARLRTCDECIGAGYGWCPMQRKCGGFANKQCGIGPNYISSAPAERNGLWESKSRRGKADAAEAPPVVDVPTASPPAPTGMLYAGPVQSPTPAPDSRSAGVRVAPSGEASAVEDVAELDVSLVTAAAQLSNTTTTPMVEDELMRLPRATLVAKILELHQEVASLRSP